MQTELLKKPFKRGDIIIYAILVILTVCLFLPLACQKTQNKTGFSVVLSGKEVLAGNFTTKTYDIYDNESVSVIDDDLVKIVCKTGYNVIKIDWDNFDVTVIETDCGMTKECSKMSLKNGEIICIPHLLIIKPIGLSSDPMVG